MGPGNFSFYAEITDTWGAKVGGKEQEHPQTLQTIMFPQSIGLPHHLEQD